MTVAKSMSQTVTCHIDKGFKLYITANLDYPDSWGLG